MELKEYMCVKKEAMKPGFLPAFAPFAFFV
jgi:hypothetical protein